MNGTTLLFLGILVAGLQSSSGFWSKKRFPPWDNLSVRFLRFYGMPENKKEADDGGWTQISKCNELPNFAGNRYVKNGDYGVVIILDSKGHIAGIQTAVPSSITEGQFHKSPFVQMGGKLYLTAYFTDPTTICSDPVRNTDYLGNKLLIQTGDSYNTTISMPLREEGVKGTKWVKGKCFYGMGQHYWYDVSKDMPCEDFYPVFLMYNKGVLNAFGWAMGAYFNSPNYEHPTWDKIGYFFQESTIPKCLKNFKGLSTQHIYLERYPLTNFC